MSDNVSRKQLLRVIVLVLLVGLVLRLMVSALRPLDTISDDGRFYLQVTQWTVFENRLFLTDGYLPSGKPHYFTSVGPVYPAFLVVLLASIQDIDAALWTLRVVQALLDTLTVLLAYGIGSRLFGRGAGLVAMAALALDLRFILQVPDPSTETLYTTLLLAGFYFYVVAMQTERYRTYALAGVVLGVATLTRPVPLLLPLALLVCAVLAEQEDRVRVLKGTGLMALTLWAVVAPWVVRMAIVTDGEFIPVSDSAASSFWMGSRGDGRELNQGEFYEALPEEIVASGYERENAPFIRAGLENVLSHPFVYAGTRFRNVLSAYLQPYGTVWFEGESIKALFGSWLRGEASLREVVSTVGFWPKLAIYGFHFTSLGFGLAGLALAWRRRREWLPLAATIAYGTAVYTVLLVLPRYLFPLMPLYWVAAGFALVWLWEHRFQLDSLLKKPPLTTRTKRVEG